MRPIKNFQQRDIINCKIHRPLAARASGAAYPARGVSNWATAHEFHCFSFFKKIWTKNEVWIIFKFEQKIKIWTIFKLKTKIEIWKKFKFWNINNFQRWTFFIYEQIQNMNNFQIWTKFIYEHFLYINKFHIWTFFIYEQIRNMNNFQVWTKIEMWTISKKYE
jgi:hypothetical protein